MKPWTRAVALSAALIPWIGCPQGDNVGAGAAPAVATAAKELDAVAEAYVKLVLALGNHDADYVDAYTGPPEWRTQAEARPISIPEIRAQAAGLVGRLLGVSPSRADDMLRLRQRALAKQVAALSTRARMLEGQMLSFDEESRALFDATAPVKSEAEFQIALDRLESLLPGEGSLQERYQKFREDFEIPAERLDEVLRAAIHECRARTLRFIPLPEHESFEVEYVTGEPWSAYNWYKGSYHSLIQINTDLPVHIDGAIDLACHEGYPGHHVLSVLVERDLVRGRGWIEYAAYPLFGPESLIAEGSAEYGIDMAFPGEERVAFERERLFPLAGIDPARAALYRQVMGLVLELDYAVNEAARRYLSGASDAAQTAAWLTRYAMLQPARAERRVRFIERYRSYVVNYNLGQDMVRQYVEREAGPGSAPERRWQVFRELLASPKIPSELL